MRSKNASRCEYMKSLHYLLIVLLASVLACQQTEEQSDPKNTPPADTSVIFRLLDTGDSLYALKKDYRSFADAMVYYDSAARLAENMQDVGIRGYVMFSKASVYNAWNKEPQRTIDLFKEAADIYRTGKDPESLRRLFYCRYLIAHAYDFEKGKDSAACVKELISTSDSLKRINPAVRKNWKFIPDLAWVATNVNHYTLAEQLLQNLTKRSEIINDPNTNNYLDHYYLTKARIDVYQYKNKSSAYLDSLQSVYGRVKENFEKLYYGQNLARLYAAAGRFENAYTVSNQNEIYAAEINDSAGIGSLQNRLLQTRLESDQKDIALKETRHKGRLRILWLLGLSLVVISVFSYRFFRGQKKYQEQSLKLEQANKQLDDKVGQIDLMSKEMQHRIKNNLQMIQSLVYMQQRITESDEVRENMQQMGLRIESIASLHQQLSENDDELIDLRDYVSRMLNTVVGMIDRNRRVLTHFDIDNIQLPLKQSFPLGLMMNEWITNSIKYAKVTNDTLSIFINIKKDGEKVTLEYFDSGKPVKEASVREGLGLQIIQLLKAQLKAEIEIDPENCFHYRMILTNRPM